jgi:hypothetical protein
MGITIDKENHMVVKKSLRLRENKKLLKFLGMMIYRETLMMLKLRYWRCINLS